MRLPDERQKQSDIVETRNGHNESATRERKSWKCFKSEMSFNRKIPLFRVLLAAEAGQKDPKRVRREMETVAVPEENRTERPETGHKDHRC